MRVETEPVQPGSLISSRHRLMLRSGAPGYVTTPVGGVSAVHSVQLCIRAVSSRFGGTQLTHPRVETMATHVSRSEMHTAGPRRILGWS